MTVQDRINVTTGVLRANSRQSRTDALRRAMSNRSAAELRQSRNIRRRVSNGGSGG